MDNLDAAAGRRHGRQHQVSHSSSASQQPSGEQGAQSKRGLPAGRRRQTAAAVAVSEGLAELLRRWLYQRRELCAGAGLGCACVCTRHVLKMDDCAAAKACAAAAAMQARGCADAALCVVLMRRPLHRCCRQQDEHLEDIEAAVSRLGRVGLTIHEELTTQVRATVHHCGHVPCCQSSSSQNLHQLMQQSFAHSGRPCMHACGLQ